MKTFLRLIAAALGLAMLLTGGPVRSQETESTAWTADTGAAAPVVIAAKDI
jgi:hypothetical protein